MAATAKRNAKVELTASSAKMDRGLAEAKRKLRQFQRDQEREAKRAAKKKEKEEKEARKRLAQGSRNVASGVKDGMMMGLGIDAAGGLQGFATELLSYEKNLTRLQITADKSPEVMRAFSDEIMRASNATGLAREDILGAASAYVALTGDMETAQRATGSWAKIAQATGTPIADIASTAAAMRQQMGITADEMETVFGGLAAQGKAGAVELKDLAGLMAQIAPQWAMFKDGKGAKGVAQLGAALQIVKRGFGGDAGETVTGLQSLLTSLVKNASRFEDGGVKVFDVKDGKKTMKDVFSIVEAISKSKLVKDPEAMEKAFGRVEAYRAYLQLVQNKQALQDMVNVASDGAGLIQRDFNTYITSPSGKIEAAWNRVKNAIAAALTPERVEGFANAIEGLASHLEPIVEGFSKVAGIMGGLYGAGQKIRGALSSAPNAFGNSIDEHVDQMLVSGQAGDVAPDKAMAARLRIQHRKEFADARDEIMAGEIGEATSPESIKRAFAAKYSDQTGARVAGDSYLRAAHVQDPIQAARDGMSKISETVAAAKLEKALKDGLHEGFAMLGIKIGGEPIQKAGANSTNHRRGH